VHNPRLTPRLKLLLARTAVLFGIMVLVCVPGLTRIGQKLETASHAPSFAKNIDCPPKKVTVTPASAVSPASSPATFHTLALAALLPSRAPLPLRSPLLVIPRPLRAPPSAPLA
jgi:hypothetical protein